MKMHRYVPRRLDACPNLPPVQHHICHCTPNSLCNRCERDPQPVNAWMFVFPAHQSQCSCFANCSRMLSQHDGHKKEVKNYGASAHGPPKCLFGLLEVRCIQVYPIKRGRDVAYRLRYDVLKKISHLAFSPCDDMQGSLQGNIETNYGLRSALFAGFIMRIEDNHSNKEGPVRRFQSVHPLIAA